MMKNKSIPILTQRQSRLFSFIRALENSNATWIGNIKDEFHVHNIVYIAQLCGIRTVAESPNIYGFNDYLHGPFAKKLEKDRKAVLNMMQSCGRDSWPDVEPADISGAFSKLLKHLHDPDFAEIAALMLYYYLDRKKELYGTDELVGHAYMRTNIALSYCWKVLDELVKVKLVKWE